MKVERELMRGAGPPAVLKLLEGGAMYGYELVEALRKRTGNVLQMGQSTLYPMLYNLESQGLVKADWRESEIGRKRKYYSLTAAGRRRLADETLQWQAVAQAMRSIGILEGGPGNLAPEGT